MQFSYNVIHCITLNKWRNGLRIIWYYEYIAISYPTTHYVLLQQYLKYSWLHCYLRYCYLRTVTVKHLAFHFLLNCSRLRCLEFILVKLCRTFAKNVHNCMNCLKLFNNIRRAKLVKNIIKKQLKRERMVFVVIKTISAFII